MTNGGNASAAGEPGTGVRGAGREPGPLRAIHAHIFGFTLFVLIAVFTVVLLWPSIFVPKRSGEQGVYWSRFFGGTSDMTLGEGTSLKFPWDDIIVYNMRVSEAHGRSVMLTKDGMKIDVEWSVRFRPDPNHLPKLHRTIGPRFEERVVIPEAISTLRQILGFSTAEEIYARDELSMLGEMQRRVKDHIEKYPIIVDSILILRLDLPEEMAKGIVNKLLSEQNLLSYTYRLKAEEAERQRKTIEAEGIKSFEEISKISVLKWRGIDATMEMAKSPNTKIVIMGTGPNGLPLLLNADK